MEMAHVDAIAGYISLEEARDDLARIAGLLVGTTDSTVFSLRLQSIKSLVTLLELYVDMEQDVRTSNMQPEDEG